MWFSRPGCAGACRQTNKVVDSERQKRNGIRIEQQSRGRAVARERRQVEGQRMARRIVAGLAALLTLGAASASFAAGPAYLGAWARADGKTKIRVASCGAAVCARNTWVKRGVSGE